MSPPSTMSLESSDKGTAASEKDHGEQPELTKGQETIIAALEPPFTEHEDVEKQTGSPTIDGQGDGLALAESVSKPSVNNIKLVPNGGLRAWLQVVSSFFVFFNTWGLINQFGAYQTFYETGILFTATPSDISWVGSIQAFLLMLVGSVTGPIYDMGYAPQLLAFGSCLIVLGQMMLSLCTELWQVILAQGFCIGIGAGCIFVTGVAILSTYFSTKIATATGLAAAGSSIGGMLYPIIFNKLQPNIGFAWATRASGFITLGTLIIANLCFKVRVVPAARRKFLDLAAWKEVPYTMFNMGCLLAFIGLYAPFFYIQSYAIDEKIMSADLAFYIISVLNGASTFGRVIPNFIADHLGPLNVIVPCAFMTGVLSLCLIAAHSTAAIFVIIAFYGFFSGTLVSLPATIYVHLAMPNNRGKIGTRMGMGFAVVSIGMLIGTPISGAILKAAGFKAVWIFGGCLCTAGSSLIAFSRFAQAGWVLWKKV